MSTNTLDLCGAAPPPPGLQTALHWPGGWSPHAQHCESPNKGLRPEGCCIDTVVLHSISLPPGEYGGPEVAALFTNTLDWDAHPYFQQIRGAEVSAHFFIRRDGALWQFVSCDERAWHAGLSVLGDRERCNDFSIGVELEGLEGAHFEDAQYTSLLTLLADLQRNYPLLSCVTSHSHIAPGRKLDPGPGFDWSRLRSVLPPAIACLP